MDVNQSLRRSCGRITCSVDILNVGQSRRALVSLQFRMNLLSGVLGLDTEKTEAPARGAVPGRRVDGEGSMISSRSILGTSWSIKASSVGSMERAESRRGEGRSGEAGAPDVPGEGARWEDLK